ncbi:MAG: flavin-dependent oxidoreductase [Chitinophagaceae bacterium]|nr:flavin-dependent oxidoreductase [Chitinophagaceae bacterium]
MKIIIAGGGIAGLTLAMSLHKKGFHAEVFESAKEIKPLGVGINLLPHAVRVLTALGLEERIRPIAVATSELAYYNKFGQKIWQEPRGKAAGYNWSQYSVHRGLLQMLLMDAAKEVMGAQNIHLGQHLLSFKNGEKKGSAIFLNRQTGRRRTTEFDMLIGADGIHSVVRKQLYPDEMEPQFSGIVLHRGTTVSKPFLSGSSMIMAGSVKQKFVAYPISPVVDEDGNQLINWIADLPIDNDEMIKERDWNRKSDKQKILSLYKNWKFDWLDIPSLIEGASTIYEFPMSDRNPVEKWTSGRVTLAGDAAHPMYPIGSNGGSQAILDAECLTGCLVTETDALKALQLYEQIRLPATAKIVLQNRQMGPEQVMQIVEDRAPNGFKNLNDVITQKELEDIANRYKQIAGFAKEELNKRK